MIATWSTPRHWVVAFAISTRCTKHCYAAQFDLDNEVTERITYPENSSYTDVYKRVYVNGTEWVQSTYCPNGIVDTQCVTDIRWVYPDLGLCAFQYYRIRLYPVTSDATMLATITEFVLFYQSEALWGGIGQHYPVTEQKSEETYTNPFWATDGLNTSFVDLDLADLFVAFDYAVLADEACVDLGRKPVEGIDWSVDGARSLEGPWYLRLNRTSIQSDIGYMQCFPMEVSDYRLCDIPSEYVSPYALPEGWQLLNGEPTSCMERSACLYNGTCAPFNSGPLCHQCSSTYAGLNGTRWRLGEKCEPCPDYWQPIVKGIVFLLAYFSLLVWLTFEQYQGSVRPWRFQHALELEEMLDLPQKAFPHLYSAAIIRILLEHQVLVALAWEECGLIQALPEGTKSIGLFIISDWFRVAQVQCVISTWEVPDQYYVAHICIGSASLLMFMVVSFILRPVDESAPKAGWTRLSEAPRVIWNLTTECLIGFFKCIFCYGHDDPEDDLTKAENRSLKAGSYTRDGVKIWKPHWWEKGPPKTMDCVLASVMLLNFLQLPLFLHSFTIYLDCVELPNDSTPVLRLDLRIQCDGEDYVRHVVGCVVGIIIWHILLPITFAVLIIGRKSDDEDGIDTAHSAYGFILGGLRPTRWWFAIWKMVLKELLVISVLLSRIGGPPQGPGFGNGPGLLAIFGAIIAAIHVGLQPYDPDRPFLVVMEGLTWLAFIAAPMTRLLLGLDATAASYKGAAYVARYIAPVGNFGQWVFMTGAILLYMSVFFVAAFAVLEQEHNILEPPKVEVEIAERVHIKMPESKTHRRWIANMVCRMFKTTMHGHIDHVTLDQQPGKSIAPGALLEAAMILTAKEQAREDGLKSAAVVEIQKEHFLKMLERIDEGEETDRLLEHRAVLEPGGLAEATLAGSRGRGKGTGKRAPAATGKVGKIVNSSLEKAVSDTSSRPSVGAMHGTNSNSAYDDYLKDADDDRTYNDGIHTFSEHKVIMFSFAIECVELRSIGFRAGEGSDSSSVRLGVKNALERGIAAAAAATEADVTVSIHPVGMDRVLVIANVGANGQDEEVQLKIREEWLRNTLGNREGRARWGKAVEADLFRVGCISAMGFRLQVRFTRGSRPQRMAQSLATAAAEATVAAASAVAVPDNKPSPVPLGKIGYGEIEDEDLVWSRDQPQGRLADASSGATNARTRSVHNAQLRAKAQKPRGASQPPALNDDDEVSDQEPRQRRIRSSSGPRRPGPRSAGSDRTRGHVPTTGGRGRRRQQSGEDFSNGRGDDGQNFAWNMV